jgi:hypothetical protein
MGFAMIDSYFEEGERPRFTGLLIRGQQLRNVATSVPSPGLGANSAAEAC